MAIAYESPVENIYCRLYIFQQTEIYLASLASGGCANGKQLAAALAMGAEGINCGTAFMATEEAPIHANVKKALVDASEKDTTHIFRTLNNTERVFKNAQAMKVREIEFANPGDFSAIAPYVKGELYRKSFQETGDVEVGISSSM